MLELQSCWQECAVDWAFGEEERTLMLTVVQLTWTALVLTDVSASALSTAKAREADRCQPQQQAMFELKQVKMKQSVFHKIIEEPIFTASFVNDETYSCV